MRKPPDLIYGVEDQPPFSDTIVVALQHVLVIAVNLVYPLLLARQAGLSSEATADMLRIGMVALAVAVLLQATARGPIGCHYLAPMVYASPYLAPGLLAVEAGGMPLFWGMTVIAGLATLAFASVWDRLRAFIPPESAGLVVFLVGATIGVAALRLLLQNDGTIRPAEARVTLIALAVMIALNVWSKGRWRLFSILVGLVCGYVVAAAAGVMEADKFRMIAGLPFLAVPKIWSHGLVLRRHARHTLRGDRTRDCHDHHGNRNHVSAHKRCRVGAAGHAHHHQRHPGGWSEHSHSRVTVFLRCCHWAC